MRYLILLLLATLLLFNLSIAVAPIPSDVSEEVDIVTDIPDIPQGQADDNGDGDDKGKRKSRKDDDDSEPPSGGDD